MSRLPLPADWLVPDWPAPPGVRAVCTTRSCPAGDAPSAAPWGGFNLADHVGDAPQAVASHRAALAACTGARPVFLEQVHGCRVAELDAYAPDGQPADAAVTASSGVACTVMVADCLPVLLARADGAAVAAAHAGWRGLAGGVIEAAAQAVRRLGPHPPASAASATSAVEVVAWLGPCIGPDAFEVGPEVRAAFTAARPEAAACFSPRPGGWPRWASPPGATTAAPSGAPSASRSFFTPIAPAPSRAAWPPASGCKPGTPEFIPLR